MLAEAASWERLPGEPPYPLEDLLAIPEVADYVEGWGRPGDAGVVAVEDGEPAGACWYRRFTPEHPGYGFIAEDVPGLGIAVVPALPGPGTGATPARRRRSAGTRARAPSRWVSASRRGNVVARRLYERAGFVVVGTEVDGLDDAAGPALTDARRTSSPATDPPATEVQFARPAAELTGVRRAAPGRAQDPEMT